VIPECQEEKDTNLIPISETRKNSFDLHDAHLPYSGSTGHSVTLFSMHLY